MIRKMRGYRFGSAHSNIRRHTSAGPIGGLKTFSKPVRFTMRSNQLTFLNHDRPTIMPSPPFHSRSELVSTMILKAENGRNPFEGWNDGSAKSTGFLALEWQPG
jgi:hypothetical protein